MSVSFVEVDGVIYYQPISADYGWIRPLFEFLDDHPDELCVNTVGGECFDCCDCHTPCCFDGTFRWEPSLPILRFTSEGLQTSDRPQEHSRT